MPITINNRISYMNSIITESTHAHWRGLNNDFKNRLLKRQRAEILR